MEERIIATFFSKSKKSAHIVILATETVTM